MSESDGAAGLIHNATGRGPGCIGRSDKEAAGSGDRDRGGILNVDCSLAASDVTNIEVSVIGERAGHFHRERTDIGAVLPNACKNRVPRAERPQHTPAVDDDRAGFDKYPSGALLYAACVEASGVGGDRYGAGTR